MWCETNLRRCISKFHRFVCDCCDKAFPLRSALDLHKTTFHPDKPTTTDAQVMEAEMEEGAAQNGVENDSPDVEKEVLPLEQASFLEVLGLQHISTVSYIFNYHSGLQIPLFTAYRGVVSSHYHFCHFTRE